MPRYPVVVIAGFCVCVCVCASSMCGHEGGAVMESSHVWIGSSSDCRPYSCAAARFSDGDAFPPSLPGPKGREKVLGP